MDREHTIEIMMNLANDLYKNGWTRDCEDKIWRMCLDWNRDNPDNEIFMCEHENENHEVDGFYIEDDYWVFEDM